MYNIPMIADDLKKEIERFLDTECGGDDVQECEEQMYRALECAIDSINEFLSTQQMTNRKFEEGKCYYDQYYELKRVTKLTPNGLWFHGAYGASRVSTDANGNQRVDGVYKVKA